MRIPLAALAAVVFTSILAPAADAEPAVVGLRVEGRTTTLFEGPLRTDGHDVRASSDVQSRPCDGTNNHAHSTPGPTPTAAAVDAMLLAGRRDPLDAQWYPGFDDYFVERFGSDGQDPDTYAYWGIVVDEHFTSVGGCQYRLEPGDQALWIYDAFATPQRPLLRLAAANDPAVPPSASATTDPGTPLALRLVHVSGAMDGAPQDVGPAADVAIAPVATDADGVELADPAHPLATTDAAGDASVSFALPGWYRVKASDDAVYVRSNRLDVCVRPCGDPPADTLVRSAPTASPTPTATATPDPGATATATPGASVTPTAPSGGGAPDPGATATVTATSGTDATATASPGGDAPSGGGSPAASAGRLRMRAPRFSDDGAARGLTGVSWRVLDAGAGVRGWTLASRTLAFRRTGAWVTRASGTTATAAQLRLPAGVTSQVRLTVVDALGRGATTSVGRVVVPRDDRAAGLRRGGRWTRVGERGAWRGTLSRGGAGATLRVRLPAGRPTFVLRGSHAAAVVTVSAAGERRTLRIARAGGGATKLVTGARRSRAGTVTLRVVSGSVDLDGVATQP